MVEKIKIAIIGAGPGGLSAAARAARLGVSHVLLEASENIANTVHRFQRAKQVMSEPAQIPLRSDIGFKDGTRESILETWERELKDHRVELRTGAKVSGISGQCGDFRIELASGEQLNAEHIVLAIGLQGNIRKLGVPGEDLPGVQYQLDDADAYSDETILVIGGGDAGVENALSLSTRNRVILLNRQEEFTNCRDANYRELNDATRDGRLEARTSTSAVRVDRHEGNRLPLTLVVQSPQGTELIECHRIIARLGATPPRKMLEGFGIAFSNSDPTAVPQLSEHYESNVQGLYIIGALAGYPLIKQALNQGYEVIEYILGNPVEPVDQALLLEKFSLISGLSSVAEGIELLRRSQPLLTPLTTLQLREFILDSEVLAPNADEVIFKKNDYGNSFFSILRGSVKIHIEQQDGTVTIITLGSGDFFGEMGLLSGRRRSATVIAGDDCILVETSRRSMLRLLDSAPSVQHKLDEVSLKRVVRSCFGNSLTEDQVTHLVQTAKSKHYAVGEVFFNEGDKADGLYLIRRGSVTVSRLVEGKELVAAYIAAGSYFGEMALVSNKPRTATVRAAAPTEVVLLEKDRFNALLDQNPAVRSEITDRYMEGVRSKELASSGKNGALIQFLMGQGIGEATDILLIDYTKCIRCDNCETACADVHDGITRLNQAAGQTFETLHIPASCRHCEQPRCMKDCPPDAIHRSLNGEVYITDNCIGCGNCQSNCPYGVIQMASKTSHKRPGILQVIFGWGLSSARQTMVEESSIKAVKCDMCMGIIGGAACVRACPTGAAFRVSPEDFLAMSSR